MFSIHLQVRVEDFDARVLGETSRKCVALVKDRDPSLKHVLESLVIYCGVVIQLVLVCGCFHKMTR